MIKNIFAAVTVLSIVFILGCSEISDLTQNLTDVSSASSFEIIREAELNSKWKINQMRIEIGPGNEFSILLQLADKDKAEGYFYLEKGDDVDFLIMGNSLIYQSEAQRNAATEAINSDRFSFVASEAQGNTYTLTFRNPADDTEEQAKVTVFIEIIYPIKGFIFFPIEAWYQ